MAITKAGKSGGASGAIDYLLKKEKEGLKNPQMIGGNVATFGTKDDVKKDFDYYSQLKPKVKNQVVHLSVSLKPGEHLDEEKKVEFSEKLLEKLNFKIDRVPYLIVEHHDKEYEHWHIVAGRIGDDGKTVKEWRIAERAISATKELEKEFGLEQVEYQNKSQRQIKRNEYKLIERTEDLSVMAEAKIVIDENLREKPTTTSFVENLQRNGFEVRPNVSETTGKMSGFAFKKDEIVFKSSSLGKQYSFQNLQKNGLDYDQPRDAEYLIEVKQNELTEKPALEVRRNRRIEISESLVSPQFVESERAASGDQRNAGSSNPDLERVSETESITQRRESFTARTGGQKSTIETAQPSVEQTESILGTAIVGFDGTGAFDERADFESHQGNKSFDESEPGSARVVDAPDPSFGFARQTDFDDYFDARRIEDGNQEGAIQPLQQLGLLNDGGVGSDYFASLIAQSQIYQNELFESQLRGNQNGAPDNAAETAGIGQGIEDFQINFESFNDFNQNPFDSSLTEQMMTVAMLCQQNDEQLEEYISAPKQSEDETLDLRIEFRMEEPQLIEREQQEIEEEMMEDHERDVGFSMSM